MDTPEPQYLTIQYKIGLYFGQIIINGWSDSTGDEIAFKTKAKVEEKEKKKIFGTEFYEVIERKKRIIPDDEI